MNNVCTTFPLASAIVDICDSSYTYDDASECLTAGMGTQQAAYALADL